MRIHNRGAQAFSVGAWLGVADGAYALLVREEALSRALQREIFKRGSPLEIKPTEAQMQRLRALDYGE